jgi:anhydro-N-acetylmuramic acid kinase
MEKIYTALGLMSGTSMDGVDASIIKSDGNREYSIKLDKYFEYEDEVRQKLINIRAKTLAVDDLKVHSDEIKSLEREITLFHANVVNEILKTSKIKIDLLGFHGQTIFHDPKKKITKQLGDGNLLSKLTKKLVIYDFRKNDLENGGQGAPLTPIYHKLLAEIFKEKGKIKLPIIILNIGGIANTTTINQNYKMTSMDIGPGNCLIDKWIRVNSDKNFDKNGDIARSGNVNKFILEQKKDNLYYKRSNKKKSLDTNDFDISFAKGLSLEDGAATITELTADIISKKLEDKDVYVCGGGRKNQFLIDSIQSKIKSKILQIDNLDIDGSFIESQAFGYLAIRSYLGLPISFPETTGCKNPCTGGVKTKNY